MLKQLQNNEPNPSADLFVGPPMDIRPLDDRRAVLGKNDEIQTFFAPPLPPASVYLLIELA